MDSPFLDPDLIREGAGDGPIGRRVMVYRETASTNDLLLSLGENDEAEGIVIFAERQTAGRGQFHRPWHSADGLGLWFSLLLRQNIQPTVKLAPYVAVAVAQALQDVLGRPLRIKAPNDIYGERGKVAGVLIEARTGAQPFAVLGLGVNVNHQTDDFPEELRNTASSLALEGRGKIDRTVVACAILRHLNSLWPELAIPNPPFLDLYEKECGAFTLQAGKL